jgi:hypothetical protein
MATGVEGGVQLVSYPHRIFALHYCNISTILCSPFFGKYAVPFNTLNICHSLLYFLIWMEGLHIACDHATDEEIMAHILGKWDHLLLGYIYNYCHSPQLLLV